MTIEGDFKISATTIVVENLPANFSFGLDFDGDDYVDLASDWKYESQELTFDAWIIPRATSATSHLLVIDQGDGAERRAARLMRGVWVQENEPLIPQIKINTPPIKDVSIATDPMIDGRLTHIAAVWRGKEMRLFVDGKRIELSSWQYDFADRAVPAYTWLGALATLRGSAASMQAKEGWKGQFLQVRLSSRALYDEDFTPSATMEADPSTIALYRFEEGQGDVLRDASGRNRHGKIIGARWVELKSALKLPAP